MRKRLRVPHLGLSCGVVHLGEVQFLIGAESRLEGSYGLLEHDVTERVVIHTQELKHRRVQSARECGLGEAQLVAGVAERDPPGRHVPSRVMIRFDALQLECSLVPLYEGAPTCEGLMARLRTQGFTPVWLDEAFRDEASGRLLQVDALFLRDRT